MTTTTHQVGDRVKVMHNIPLGNLFGTVKAIHQRPKYDVYEVSLDGGGTDQLYDFQLQPLPTDDSWISLSDRKPTLRTPIVEVLFSNGEIEESRFWYGAFENDFQRFEATRPGCEITHWREK